ncbi:MAG: tetratricopeptide repeat protein, partial [Caldilineaceae bacterium]|nr:tetratricopeptide repeat protein [Caldilineaceae bacterium]
EWLFSRERYTEAQQIAEQLKTKHQTLIQDGGDLVAWHLDAWHGALYDYLGRYDDAETLLTTTVHNLLQWRQNNAPTRYSDGILARAYNNIGYHYSRRTRHFQAIRAYGRAVQLLQELGLYVDEANTLNNRAFDIAKIGDFAAAISSAKAGLRLREQLGPRTPVGLSLNTLGLIELSQFHLEGGLRDIRRAMETFRGVGSTRGLGLALIAYAEALRRISVSVIYLQQRRTATIMADALVQANQAIEIFTYQVDEPPRLMEAWREQARIYRDWAKLRLGRPAIVAQSESEGGKFTVEELVRQSQVAFEQASALVPRETITQIELLYDQALLLYYIHLYPGAPRYVEIEAQLERKYILEMNQLIPVEYHALPGPDNKLPRVWYLVQKGNIELLSGHLAFNRWNTNQSDEDTLCHAVEHYGRALTYYAYFSRHDFQEKRQALDELYEQLRPLTARQKRKVHEYAHVLEGDHEVDSYESPLSQFLHERFGDFADEFIF